MKVLVRARSRVKNEIHAALMRCLADRPPAAELFGAKARRWLEDRQLAVCERETVDAGLRLVNFLDSEIAAVDQLIAAEALGWPEVKRLMSVPASTSPSRRPSWPPSATSAASRSGAS